MGGHEDGIASERDAPHVEHKSYCMHVISFPMPDAFAIANSACGSPSQHPYAMPATLQLPTAAVATAAPGAHSRICHCRRLDHQTRWHGARSPHAGQACQHRAAFDRGPTLANVAAVANLAAPPHTSARFPFYIYEEFEQERRQNKSLPERATCAYSRSMLTLTTGSA